MTTMTTTTKNNPDQANEPVASPIDDGFLLGVDTSTPSAPSSPPVGFVVREEEGELHQAEPPVETEILEVTDSVQIPDRLYFRIGDVAELAGVKPYVLRYWESEFSMIAPQKSSNGQRVFRRADVETILLIKQLLYREKYSIEGARKRLQELKRDGALKAFRQDKLFGGAQAAKAQETLKASREAVQKIQGLIQVPMHDLFRY